MRRTPWALAWLAASVLAAGALGAAGLSSFGQPGPSPGAAERTLLIEVAPEGPGPYTLYLPIPVGADGRGWSELSLAAEQGHAELGLVRTEHGDALRLRGEGPLRLVGGGEVPLQFTMDDVPSTFRQFKFWGYLERGSPPLLLKLSANQRQHTADWERHLDTGRSVVVQQALDPEGWQVLRATHYFDFRAAEGYGAGVPRLALGALAAGLAVLYVPLGLVVWRSRGAA